MSLTALNVPTIWDSKLENPNRELKDFINVGIPAFPILLIQN